MGGWGKAPLWNILTNRRNMCDYAPMFGGPVGFMELDWGLLYTESWHVLQHFVQDVG